MDFSEIAAAEAAGIKAQLSHDKIATAIKRPIDKRRARLP